MITSVTKILQLPSFDHMTTSMFDHMNVQNYDVITFISTNP